MLIAGWLFAPGALADGDPASDVLVSQDVFLPRSVAVSRSLAAQLVTLVGQAQSAGTPIKVAVVAGSTDLGSITSLYGRPGAYARYLSIELEFVTRAPLLVVMPQGLALASAGKLLSDARIRGISVRSGPAGLVRAALAAVGRLEPGLGRSEGRHGLPARRPVTKVPAPAERSAAAPDAPSFGTASADRPSESFIGAVAGRFERGATQPVVWLALAITLALIVGMAGVVYLIARGGFRS